ncbi:Nuclear poly(A) polymerase 3 [Senna tora]|uniref:Nuclear poly(A) polymerase 3 n=1 Tax=Senna tora TaxID=362788 RepID=A0A835CEZ7_9FABA|nr:Nuclear poly(A) polymerase 3 [Senna tora]
MDIVYFMSPFKHLIQTNKKVLNDRSKERSETQSINVRFCTVNSKIIRFKGHYSG